MAFPTTAGVPYYQLGAGIRTDFGMILPVGTRAIYVRSTGVQSGDTQAIAERLLPTLAAALSECRSGQNDTVFILPGHSESVTTGDLANLVAGTKIIGLGQGGNKPVFRWGATTSQWAIAVADVLFQNLRLRLEGAVVVKAIAVTAADVTFDSCEFETASGASNYAALGIELGTGADRCTISNCRFRGKTATAVTQVISTAGTAQTGFRILDTDIVAPGHATTGLISIGNAATEMLFANLRLYNTVAASTCTINLADFASDGLLVNIDSGTKNDGTVTAQGIIFGTSTVVMTSRCFCVDQVKKNSTLSPAAGT